MIAERRTSAADLPQSEDQVANDKECFFVAPIGAPGSPTRNHSDQVLRYVVNAAVAPLGYRVVRADQLAEPGTITLTVVRHLLQAELVVADLTGLNPNVMYELAIRHARNRPVILLIKAGEKLPFDVAQERTVFFELSLEGVEVAVRELLKQVQHIETNGVAHDNPISALGEVIATKPTARPLESYLIDIVDDLGAVKKAIRDLESRVQGQETDLSKREMTNSRRRTIKISAPGTEGRKVTIAIDVDSDETLSGFLDHLYFELNERSSFKPRAFKYLWDWILVRESDGAPLFVKGPIQDLPMLPIADLMGAMAVEVLKSPLVVTSKTFGIVPGVRS